MQNQKSNEATYPKTEVTVQRVEQDLNSLFERIRGEGDWWWIHTNGIPDLEAALNSCGDDGGDTDRVRRNLQRLKKLCLNLNRRDSLFTDHSSPAYCAQLYQALNRTEYPSRATLRAVRRLPPLGRGHRPGLLFYGPTGAGKTFIAWHEARRWLDAQPEWLNILDGDSVCFPSPAYAFTAPRLKALATSVAMRDAAAVELWQGLLASRGLVLIDDLHQARLSSAFAEKLFELIERVTSERRPLIVTLQLSGANLLKKWKADEPSTSDTAAAIIRRLLDHCVPVRVEKGGIQT